MKQDVYRLKLRATDRAFCLQRLEQTTSSGLTRSTPTDGPVPNSVIGYWVELLSQDSQVLYRHYLHTLPLNLPLCWQLWGKRKQRKAQYEIEVPALPQAHFINLYEQRFNSPQQKSPEKERHFELTLQGAEVVGA